MIFQRRYLFDLRIGNVIHWQICQYSQFSFDHNPRVNTDLILMVRQLQPTPQGLPIELYFFSANKDWIPYERLQAEVFDHLLAVLPEFGLRVFQIPSGLDVLSLSSH